MMVNIVDLVSQFLKFGEVRAETSEADECENAGNSDQKWFWPRLLLFNSDGTKCEEEENFDQPTTEVCVTLKDPVIERGDSCRDEERENEQEEDEEQDNEDEDGDNDSPNCRQGGGFRQKLGCIQQNAKFGLKEGTLSGIFIGGALGLYKYIDGVYVKGESSGGGSDNSGDSTVNDNIIFVTAINGAVAMAVFCTILCCSKGIMHC